MKKLRYIIESVIVRIFIRIFRLMSPETASNCGGAIGKFFGFIMRGASKRAKKHIKMCLNTNNNQTGTILNGMWDNLGRIFAEYPHLQQITTTRTILIGQENLIGITENSPAIFFAAHLANWEVAAPTLRNVNIDVDLIYRPPNNPYVRDVLDECRSMGGTLKTYPKSASGMRMVITALKQGRKIGILIDQKYNQGIAANFFGHTAMTSPAFIQLAKKFNCPLIPVQVERMENATFRVTIHPRLDIERDEMELINQSHNILEGWIKSEPSSWLWLHKRWRNLSLFKD